MSWVAFTGYMGAGKSVVGRRVAQRLGWEFVDADKAIEQHAGMSIPEIFAKRGELWFRRTEEDVIRGLIQGAPSGVIALGGGALGSARTRDLVSRLAWVVWLRVDPEVAWERVSGSDRPLAGDKARFIARAIQREPVYQEAADLEVASDDSPDDVAARVAAWVVGRESADQEA